MDFFDSLKAYVGFTGESSAHLRALLPAARPHFAAIVDDFYRAIETHPEASAVITGGAAQIARLKQTLADWLETLLRGPHDEAYCEMRSRIGRVHVRIGLPQGLMFVAMNRIRVRLLEVTRVAAAHDPVAFSATATAVEQMIDIELALMLETYREDLVRKYQGAERLSTIGQLAAGIGHELRNPLGVIESSLYLVRQHLARAGIADAKIERHLDKIGTEVQRSNKTITDLLELARNRPPHRERVDARRLLESALEAAALPPAIEVAVDVAEGAWIDGDADQLRQVVVNLLSNAEQAMQGQAHGRVALEARRTDAGATVRVRDEGPGVPGEVRHRIFEALFTTKAKGSGLGLALCRRIAEAHGGQIALESVDRGASFILNVPDRPPAPGAAA